MKQQAHISSTISKQLLWLRRLGTGAGSLYSSTSYLLGSAALSAVFGFVFWAVTARLASAEAIGMATAAIAGAGIIIAAAELGIGAAVVHFTRERPEQTVRLINTAAATSLLLSGLGCLVFLAGLPVWASGLSPVVQDWRLLGTFIAFTLATSALTLHDAAMLSQNNAAFVFWRNLACNLPPLLLLVPLIAVVGSAAAPLLAFCLPNVLTGLVSGLWLMPRAFQGFRLVGRLEMGLLSQIGSYSLGTHLANLLWSSATFAMPLIAINTLSAESAGHFYVPWAIANVVLTVPRAGTSALFVEGTRGGAQLHTLAARTLGMLALLLLPLVAALWFLGPWVLSVFGRGYVNEPVLQILLASAFPFSLNSVVLIGLRVQRRLLLAGIFCAGLSAVIIALAGMLASVVGVEGLAWGWTLGQTSFACVALAVLLIRSAPRAHGAPGPQ